MWWVGMQRVQMTWYRMKKGDDVNILMKNPQFEELMTSYATVNLHRVTSDSISVRNHQICSLLTMLEQSKLYLMGGVCLVLSAARDRKLMGEILIR